MKAVKLILLILVFSIFFCKGYAQNNGNGNGNGNNNSWNQGGDSLSSKGIIGTKNNKPIGIKTNDVERMTILETGEVGIGTDEPTEKLDVDGDTRFRGNVHIEQDLNVAQNATIFGELKIPALVNQGNKILWLDENGTLRSKTLVEFFEGPHDFTICADYKSTPYWKSKFGAVYTAEECPDDMVGIGTENPLAKLDVRGGTKISRQLDVGEDLNVSGYGYIGGKLGIGNSNPQSRLHITQNAGALNLEGSNHVYMQFYPNGFSSGRKGWIGFGSGGNTDLSICTEQTNGKINLTGSSVFMNGNLGIGAQPESAYKLKISGITRSCRLEIEAYNWCDYVFEPDYKLKSIDEFTSFISENKHLPGMPPEKELLEKGIDVFEMFKMQQKIIEEYALYIELLNQRIKKLEEKE